MKTMKSVLRKENMHPSSASKSHIPRPHTGGKKMKAKPAPDFGKLHKRWEEKLQIGKSCKKKPATVAQPFDVTKPGTRFIVQTKTTVLNDMDEFDVDFEGDQEALETILHSKGLSERKATGRTTLETMSMSTGKIKKKSCTNLGKRRILGELPCDSRQLTEDTVVTAKKSLPFNQEKKTNTEVEEFEEDPEALHSILTDEGIVMTTSASTDDRQTVAGSVCRPSLLHHPLPARQSCVSAISKKTFSKFDTEALIQSVRDRQQGITTDYKHPDTTKSPFKPASGKPVVIDSPFGQKVMIQNRNSIYGDYHIHPITSPAVTTMRSSVYGNHQPLFSPAVTAMRTSVYGNRQPLSSPAVMGTKQKPSDTQRSVKWADVLNSYSYYSSCAVPKIKEKKTLFTTIDEIDNDIDECKENVQPSQQQHTIDKIYYSTDVTTASDGQHKNESSCVATSSQNTAVCSMTHSTPLEPAEKHHIHIFYNSVDRQQCKVNSSASDNWCGQQTSQDGTPTAKLLAARRIPIGTSCSSYNKHDSDLYQNCVSVTTLEKNRTVCKNIETSLHQSGISALPKQGGSHNGTAFNLRQLHSNSNLESVQVSGDFDDAIKHNSDNNLKIQVKGEVVSLSREFPTKEMAMHTDEKEEKDESEVVSSDSNSQTVKSRPCRTGSAENNESVDKFVGRVKKSRKRQSIVELNESIVESQVHMHKLQAETEKLQDVKEIQEMEGSQTNINILQQLQLIAKQQEQLQILQKQLQEQLSTQQIPVPTATITLSHDTRDVSSANESNNNIQQQQQTECHVTGNENVLDVNTRTDNILNNNVLAEDNQNISQPMSIFVSSSAALSQTLTHSSRSTCQDLTLTPSNHRPRVAIETESDITPYVTKIVPHISSKLSTTGGAFHKQIRTPTPVKQETSSCVNNLFSSVPPLWTPLALKEASVDQQNSTPKLCDNDIKTCTSQVAAIDLSVKRPIDDENLNFQNVTDLTIKTGDRSVSPLPISCHHRQGFTPISAFSHVRSASHLDDNKNVGSLSLRANTFSSPVDFSSKKKRLSLRRTITSVTGDRYQEALLDEECALYSCRLQTMATPGCIGHSYINPVAKMLLEGDEMHFIPIREDSPVRHYVREGSAFSCYSP